MKIENHLLYDREGSPWFTSYRLENSIQYQTGCKRPAVIICPGGGYLFLSDREAEPIALTFLQHGFQAFVLHYSIGTADGQKKGVFQQALIDLASTMKIVRDHAEQWFVNPDKIALVGFSAGAHLAASLSVHWQEGWLAAATGSMNGMLNPNAVILAYPLCDYSVMADKLMNDTTVPQEIVDFLRISTIAVSGSEDPSELEKTICSPIKFVNPMTPLTFLWHTADDEMVFVENSLKYAMQLSKYKIPFELHVFETGSHGLALANEVTATRPEEVNESCQIWVELAITWLKKHKIAL